MAFWRGETLQERLPNLVEPFNMGAIDCAAYTLHIGNEVYVSPNRKSLNASRHTKQKLAKGQGFAIPPGQFAFLLSHETVKVPDDALAFLSIKARVKFNGLINISGFHVDPGYDGRLLFSVLNAGPRPLHLEQGQPLFLLWYADLDGKTSHRKTQQGFDSLEPQLINGISGEIYSLQSLSEEHRALERQFESRQSEQEKTIAGLNAQVKFFWVVTVPAILLIIGLVVQYVFFRD